MTGLSDSHAQWLEDRKIDVEVAVKYGVHSRGPALAIPYIVAGKQLYVKTRDPRDKTLTRCLPAGLEQTQFWNADCLLDEPTEKDTLIITEGELDALVMLSAGYQFVVSLPSGASATKEGAASKAQRVLTTTGDDGELLLDRRLAKFRRVAVLTDGDHDGVHMRRAIVELLGEEYCWLPTYPDGTKDANDVILAHGVAGVRALVEKARPVKDDGFVGLVSASARVKPLEPMHCGLDYLDPHFMPVCPSFIVIGGQAGHGKSTIVQAIVFNMLWKNPGLRASIYHAEGDVHILLNRARLFYADKTGGRALSDVQKGQRDAWIEDRIGLTEPPQDEMPTFKWLLWSMERQALYHKRNVFVVDPWNQVVLDPGSRNKTDYIGECIYEMKRLAKRHGLILIVAHHTTKAIDARTPPNRYSLADSAHWVNAADHLLIGWKPEEAENLTRLEIAKSKDHQRMGRPGSVWVGLEGENEGGVKNFRLLLRNAPAGFNEHTQTFTAYKPAPASPPAEDIADPGEPLAAVH